MQSIHYCTCFAQQLIITFVELTSLKLFPWISMTERLITKISKLFYSRVRFAEHLDLSLGCNKFCFLF